MLESQEGFSEEVTYKLYMKKAGAPSGRTVREGFSQQWASPFRLEPQPLVKIIKSSFGAFFSLLLYQFCSSLLSQPPSATVYLGLR